MSGEPGERPPTWPDGTPKSQGNAFTSHGFKGGLPPAPSKAPRSYEPGPRSVRAFGGIDGQIPGMGNTRK